MDIDFKIFTISKSYFTDYPALTKEADLKETRVYLGIIIKINKNNCFVPFESKLPDNEILKKFCHWPLPSSTRPKAGLNFEKSLKN